MWTLIVSCIERCPHFRGMYSIFGVVQVSLFQWCQMGSLQCLSCRAGKPVALSIGEEERRTVDFDGLSSSMEAAVKALKWEYANTIVTRITLGMLAVDTWTFCFGIALHV